MQQVIINILSSGITYLVVAISFTIIYNTTKFFNVFHAFVLTISSYFMFLFSIQLQINITTSIVLSIIFASLIGLLSDLLLFRWLRKYKSPSFLIMIASLGLYIVFQNIVSLIWGDSSIIIRQNEIKVGYEFLGAYITGIQIITFVIGILLLFSFLFFLKYSIVGKNIHAVSSNEQLSNIFGIDSNKVILWSYGIGSTLVSIMGILIAFDTDMTPTMGFNILLFGIVTMIIGGVNSLKGLIGGALLLATAQHLSAYYIDSKWMDATAYIILILFLIWKPLGFSGKRLKKVEI